MYNLILFSPPPPPLPPPPLPPSPPPPPLPSPPPSSPLLLSFPFPLLLPFHPQFTIVILLGFTQRRREHCTHILWGIPGIIVYVQFYSVAHTFHNSS